MSFEKFYVDYGPQGMIPKLGGDPDLVKLVESLGIGMETSGEWAIGGPLVWRRDDGRRVLGWIQAADVHRTGACRAWGIQLDGHDERILNWPWRWDVLKAGPQKLDELASSLSGAPRGAPPKLSDEFSGILSEAWRRQARRKNDGTLFIPLKSPSELPALAWFWLLGPVDPLKATLGPPRVEPAVVTPPLTYAGQVVSQRPFINPSERIEEKFFDKLREAKYQDAILEAQQLRRMTPEKLATVLDTTPKKVFSRSAESGAPLPRRHEPFDWRATLQILSVALQLIVFVLVLAILRMLQTPAQSTPQRTVPQMSTAMTTSTQTAPVTSTTAGDPIPDQVVGVALHSGLKRLSGVTFSGPIAPWIRSARPAMARGDIARARTAALQVYFLRKQCATPRDAIDGVQGPGFYDAVHCLARNGDPLDVLRDDQKLIEWLESEP